ALDPFFDHSLRQRVQAARFAWLRNAEERLREQTDEDLLDEIRAAAAEKLAALEAEIEAINEALRQNLPSHIDYPPIMIPEPEIDPDLHRKPLVSSAWSWIEQTFALKRRKAYAADPGEPGRAA